MAEPPIDQVPLKAILFDLDGTLYRQDALRLAILLRLLQVHATDPLCGLRTLRVLSAYRRAQECLREPATSAAPVVDLAEAQLQLAVELTRAEPGFVAECVGRWMEREPLAFLARNVRPGLRVFLQACRMHGLRLGVSSDYPAEAKLKALGLRGFFDAVVAAQSPGVGVFKPDPRGLLLALERLGVSPAECLYVGDRAEVDAAAAAAAGVCCCILTRRFDQRHPRPWMQVTGFPQLQQLILRRLPA